MKPQVESWFRSAEVDLSTIEAIVDRPDLSSMIAFLSQQCVEKVLKATILNFTGDAPRTHKLDLLHEMAAVHLDYPLDRKVLMLLDLVYTDTRYPNDVIEGSLVVPSMETARMYAEAARKLYEFVRYQSELNSDS